MKRQSGFRVIRGAAWLAIAGAIGSVSAADFAIKDKARTDPARLDWAALSRDAQVPSVAQLDWTALSSQSKLARDDAPNAYVGTSLAEPPARDRLDWTGLSK